jgi:hypothetical protein
MGRPTQVLEWYDLKGYIGHSLEIRTNLLSLHTQYHSNQHQGGIGRVEVAVGTELEVLALMV